MIIRIATDNQYRLDDGKLGDVQRLDDQLVSAMDTDNHQAFASALTSLVALVRDNGTPVPPDEVVPSDIIVPAPDMSLAEARGLMEHSSVSASPPPSSSSGGQA